MSRRIKGDEAVGSGYGIKTRDDERRKAKLEPEVQQALGRELRALYHEVLSEPVPDKFRELLDKLEDQETKPGSRASHGRDDDG